MSSEALGKWQLVSNECTIVVAVSGSNKSANKLLVSGMAAMAVASGGSK